MVASTCHRHGADTSLRRLTGEQALTIAGLVALVVLTLVFDLDVGLVANTIAVVLGLFAWQTQREAVDQIPWSVMLLICGVLTYVGILEEIGTIEYAGNAVASVGMPLLAALLICYVGAIVSAFASSIGVSVPPSRSPYPSCWKARWAPSAWAQRSPSPLPLSTSAHSRPTAPSS